MKKLLLVSCVLIANVVFAKDLAKVNVAVLRNNQMTHGKTSVVKDCNTNIAFEDERTYIEMDILEITETQMVIRCLISTASAENNGMLVVRGMPRLVVPLQKNLGMASLNCDGNDEHFMLIVSVCPY
jgi:hypothetical protein